MQPFRFQSLAADTDEFDRPVHHRLQRSHEVGAQEIAGNLAGNHGKPQARHHTSPG